jgi:hypothetical protein
MDRLNVSHARGTFQGNSPAARLLPRDPCTVAIGAWLAISLFCLEVWVLGSPESGAECAADSDLWLPVLGRDLT